MRRVFIFISSACNGAVVVKYTQSFMCSFAQVLNGSWHCCDRISKPWIYLATNSDCLVSVSKHRRHNRSHSCTHPSSKVAHTGESEGLPGAMPPKRLIFLFWKHFFQNKHFFQELTNSLDCVIANETDPRYKLACLTSSEVQLVDLVSLSAPDWRRVIML